MKGFIVKSGCEYLTKALFWYDHESADQAYVFSDEEIKSIRDKSSGWQIKPQEIVPATYQDGVVTVTGASQAF